MTDASRLISGRYRLGELLGTGGSASVFAAVDEHNGAPVALKILHPHLSDRPTARDAFLAEARRAEPLRHPNIVGVLGVGVDESGEAPLAWIGSSELPARACLSTSRLTDPFRLRMRSPSSTASFARSMPPTRSV